MCGIMAYVGGEEAKDKLLEGLKSLEYRGYDSSGMAVFQKDEKGKSSIRIVKSGGEVFFLEEKLKESYLSGHCGIAHTRWATHGLPTSINAHPHVSNAKRVVLVHNGIIENYLKLKVILERKGYEFYSETDTEVIANFLESLLKEGKSKKEAFEILFNTLVGSFALAVMFDDEEDCVWFARKDSPLVVGVCEKSGDCLLSSDVLSILPHTRKVCYVKNNTFGKMGKSVELFDSQANSVECEYVEEGECVKAPEKGEYKHFMAKEIFSQPQAVKNCMSEYFDGGILKDVPRDLIKNTKRVLFVACGSAYHASLVGARAVESLAKIPAWAELASEFRYREYAKEEGTLFVVISQSGETADSLASLKRAKALNMKTLAIVNVKTSSISRETDYRIFTPAGAEIAVATTKAYTCQILAAFSLAILFSLERGEISHKQVETIKKEIYLLPDKIQKILEREREIKAISYACLLRQNVFFIGRGSDYFTCMEGSLKLKEISYIPSCAYAAGELKHGTISLVERGTLVVCVMTEDGVFEKTLSNLQEVKSRGADIFLIVPEELEKTRAEAVKKIGAKFIVKIPETHALLYPVLSVIPLQLFAYHVSAAKGLNPDKPRNLAKSVTVE